MSSAPRRAARPPLVGGGGGAVAGLARRAALVLAVACALGAVPVADLGALPALAAAPHPVSGEDHAVDLAEATTRAPAAVDAPAEAGTTVKEVAVGEGSLVGVTLDAGTDASLVRVRVQDDDGTWGEWTELDVEGGPDEGSLEAGAAAASDPLWIGEGDAGRRLQVQLPAADAGDAALAVVDPGTSRADAAVTAAGPASSASAAPTGMPAVHPRSDWGADESLRSCSPSYAATTLAAVLHHTAGSNDYAASEVPALMRGIYRYHTQTQGWCDVGYNVLVDRFGGLWEGRAGGLDKAVVGAHTGGFNSGTFGVAMIGTYSDSAPSAATQESVARIIAWKLGGTYVDPDSTVTLVSAGGGTSRYAAGQSVTLPRIFGHRDVGATACPGNGGYARLPWVRSRVDDLVGGPSGVVYDKWRATGGAGGVLGSPFTVEGSTPDGRARYTNFAGGSAGIYSTAAGTFEVHGAIYGAWAAQGWETGALGYPRTDETSIDGGAYNHFQGGSVYWSPATGAQVLRGAVLDRWGAAGWERSWLGYPTTSTRRTPDGTATYSHFQNGSVYAGPFGSWAVSAPVYAKWASLGWERSSLGYPTSDAATTPDGSARYEHFQGGSVYVTSAGSFAVTSAVRSAWGALDWERSRLGLPTSDTTDGLWGTTTSFEGGTVTTSTLTGRTSISYS